MRGVSWDQQEIQFNSIQLDRKRIEVVVEVVEGEKEEEKEEKEEKEKEEDFVLYLILTCR